MGSDGKFYLDSLSVIFLPDFDEKNGCETLVLDRKHDEVIRINRAGYQILKLIDDFPGLIFDQMMFRLGSLMAREQLDNFINDMLSRNIVVKI